MKVAVEVAEKILATLTKRSLEKDVTVQTQIRAALELYVSAVVESDKGAHIVALDKEAYPRARKSNHFVMLIEAGTA